MDELNNDWWREWKTLADLVRAENVQIGFGIFAATLAIDWHQEDAHPEVTMNPFAGFANIHPFFVHAPLILIPVATLMVWLGRRIRQEGFETAVLVLTVFAALGALTAMITGLRAEHSFAHSSLVQDLIEKHETNGIVVTVVTVLAALLAVAEWKAWIGAGKWWIRAALLTFASIGCLFSGHTGATLVYVHGAAVGQPAAPTRPKQPAAPRSYDDNPDARPGNRSH